MHFSNLVELPLDSTNGIMKDSWPPFMVPNKQSLYNWNQVRTKFPSLQICLCDGDQVIGVVNSLPLRWNGDSKALPEHWDDILMSSLNQTIESSNTLSAINLAVDPKYRRQGISKQLIQRLKATAKSLGYRYLIVPLRPSFKVNHPEMPFMEYIHAKNNNGLPIDPWMRVHYKLGARIIKPMPNSFVTQASIVDWEKWTNQQFNSSGQYIVEGALMPIEIDLKNRKGIYADPNVWMKYDLK